MKKRILALMLVMAMVLGMSMTTFAAEEVNEGSFTKTYTVTGGDTVPAETLAFTVTPNTAGKVPTLVVGDNNTFAVDGTKKEYTIPFEATLVDGVKAGIYTYTISEVAGATQGVTYGTATIDVSVLVELEAGTTPVIAKIGVTKIDNAEKQTIIDNKYDLGSLKVTKNVTGNLGDKNKEFTMTVNFSSDQVVLSDIENGPAAADWEKVGDVWKASKEITIKHGENNGYTFNNIPAGVTYEVVENDYTQGDANSDDGYDTPVYSYSDNSKAIAQSDADTVQVTNNKSADINTGVIINNFPFILALAAVALVAVAFMRKRRSF